MLYKMHWGDRYSLEVKDGGALLEGDSETDFSSQMWMAGLKGRDSFDTKVLMKRETFLS